MTEQENKKMLYITLAISSIYYIIYALFFSFNSLYLSKYLNNPKISFLFFISFLLSFYFSTKLIRLINKKHSFRLSVYILSTTFISSMILWLSENIVFLYIFDIILTIGLFMLLTMINLFIEDFTDLRRVGSVRSINLIITHASIIFGLLIGSYVIRSNIELNINIIFLLISALHIPIIFIFKKYYNSIKDPDYKNINLSKTYLNIINNTNLKGIFISALGLEAFFSVINFFLPLYIINKLGMSTFSYFALILPLAMIPYLILPYILEELSEFYGQKKMLITGYFIIFIICMIIPFTNTSNVIIWSAILITSRIGTSIIDTMNNIYFYKSVDRESIGAINLFTNTRTLGYLIGTAIISVILFIINNILVLFFVYLLFGVYIISNIFKIKDIK